MVGLGRFTAAAERLNLSSSAVSKSVVWLERRLGVRTAAFAVAAAGVFSDRFVDPVHEDIGIVVRSGGSDAWSAAPGHCYFDAQRQVFCASPGYLQAYGAPPREQANPQWRTCYFCE